MILLNLIGADDVIGDLGDLVRAIRETDRLVEPDSPLFREAATSIADRIRYRVQVEGRGSSGEIMVTRSDRTLGRYSRSHGTERQRKGLQTAHIDLTFSDQLFDAWGVIDGSDVGFSDSEMARRADYLEQYFGPIFDPTDDERQQAESELERLVNQRIDLLL